ncbi:uncharacterized protein LY89DRAFT_593878 [Mollisia scopiformis]|uniref:Uncharacterized protein n=1 Tax=Mollisia scopiformis TaxID=149040 RepID=A0A194WVH8_MOLSC|nr:uncharacterized protein LY89DRAFT_593878 [Mollisia scopiformis]KUJ11973.1 hypothetical protein LY89DRAFT_593878 [Mollisia scopiformis]
MQNGPVPTTLTLLSELGKLAPGSKVRFLGCVTNYSTKTATLTLEHNHPPGNLLQAQVDVTLLVTTMKSNDTQIGEWVNVMGYLTSRKEKQTPNRPTLEVGVQAIVLWSSGSFNLQAYEESLDKHTP